MDPHLCTECDQGRHDRCINAITAEFKSTWVCICATCCPDPLFDSVVAAENKRLGMDRSVASTPSWYKQRIWDALIFLLCKGGEVSNVEVWEHLGVCFPRSLGGRKSATVMGPIMASACKAGLMTKSHMEVSTVVSRHAPEVWVYVSEIAGQDPAKYPYKGKR